MVDDLNTSNESPPTSASPDLDPSSQASATGASGESDDSLRSTRLLTIPNVLCAIRLLGCPVLLWFAFRGQSDYFLWLFLFLAMTDWVDGKLAILLNQRTVFGARLDSWADASLYGCLLVGGLWLKWTVLSDELPWIAAAVISYGVTTAAGFWKFGRWPSYHTRAAKTSWFLITVGAICLLADWTIWPLRIAMLSVTLTNLEATLITFTLPRWQANVPSLWHARRLVESR